MSEEPSVNWSIPSFVYATLTMGSGGSALCEGTCSDARTRALAARMAGFDLLASARSDCRSIGWRASAAGGSSARTGRLRRTELSPTSANQQAWRPEPRRMF
jgi:hypothetical protein